MSAPPKKKVTGYLNATNKVPRQRINKYAPTVTRMLKILDDLINNISKTPDKNFNARLPTFAKQVEKLKRILTKTQMLFKESVASIINHSRNSNEVKNALFTSNQAYQGGRIQKDRRGKYRVVIQSDPKNASTILSANKFDSFINSLLSNLVEKKVELNEAANQTRKTANTKAKGQAAAAAAAQEASKRLKGSVDKKALLKNLKNVRRNITSSGNGGSVRVTVAAPLSASNNKKRQLRNRLIPNSLVESGIRLSKPSVTARNRELVAALQNNRKPLNSISITENNYQRLMNLL